MVTLLITDLSGQTEFLTGYSGLTRKREVNGDLSLSFNVIATEGNAHSFDMVSEESVITYDDNDYRIKSIQKRSIRETPFKFVSADHVFFDIVDAFQYDTLDNGFKSINQTLSFALQDTGFTFTVVDGFSTVEFENFGNDNSLALFQKILERYGAEFEVNGTELRIYQRVGPIGDFQFRYAHNIKTFSYTGNTENLSTYIKGFGKQNEDGSYVVQAEYTSPMAATWGIKHAKPVYDERYTTLAGLKDRLRREIQDTVEVSMEVEFVELEKQGYQVGSPKLGEEILLIHEPLKLDVSVRILAIEDYPESNKSPKIKLANLRQTLADASFNRTKSLLDQIYDENVGRLRYNVYNEAVKRATEALNNSLTELEYPVGMGIVARDPNDPDRFVALRSNGLGVTTDGGLTFKEAITSDGVTTSLLTAGQIKTNNIQIIGNDDLFYWDGTALMAISESDANKYVKLNSDGLYVKKGMITVEDSTGFKTIIGGKLTQNFEVQHQMPMKVSPTVTVSNAGYWQTQSTQYGTATRFTYNHLGRYLILELAQYCEPGGQCYIQVYDTADGAIIGSSVSNNTDNNFGTGSTDFIVIDLGSKTGVRKSAVVNIRSNSGSLKAYASMIRGWISDSNSTVGNV